MLFRQIENYFQFVLTNKQFGRKIEKNYQNKMGGDGVPTAYQTKQKDRILAQLAAHPFRSYSVKDIYELCRRSGTPVGMATVYRQLDGLAAENRVGKIVSEDGRGLRYQYLDDSGHDFHIKCDNCGKLSPVCCGILDGVSAHMSEEHGFRIDAAKSVLYGRCRDCP